ncbi:hypothetical protein X760_28340 [Mesorhizobium sp. LSHC422A00]|nr:hypothetical protein X760_28340 [Mesorhizobium sp. LSHC422A00]ESZ40250.1 hypothetical protein X731_26290 [Mesorhizobium sp. L2C054A000]
MRLFGESPQFKALLNPLKTLIDTTSYRVDIADIRLRAQRLQPDRNDLLLDFAQTILKPIHS